MSKQFRPLLAFLILAIAALACDVQIPPVSLPGSTPVQNTVAPPASPDPNAVGTAVAMTLTAAVPGGDNPTAAVTTSPAPDESDETTGVLPHSLCFLAPDNDGINQVFRLNTDGTTQQQLTSETSNVGDYDVSLADGAIVYVANNQLLYANADGSERRVLVDGGVVDENNPFISTVSSPVFSLDGQTVAYGYKGLQFYSFSSGESQLVIENLIDDTGGGLFVPRELYSPERYSPDGTKLLITLGYYEGASSAIYYPVTNALVRLTGGEGALICCEDVEWAADSSSFYSASANAGMFSPGLWRVDAATGEVTTLITGDAGGGNFNAAKEAYLASDDQLYFFFGTVSSPEGMFNRAPLQPVRASADGETGRTVLSSEDFQLLNEALWAPDASFVVVAMAPAQEVYQGGQAEIVYFDGAPRVGLAPFAQQMKWGP
ncbi:MAG TPA: hypothetical protein VK897_16740 [Anaerolineales bacterium]|nr:hypothetical protein [Anaerolineales bacterium]